ncbi:MAG: hypothetical protein SGPRY_006020, partial [Prymnesium sp.]
GLRIQNLELMSDVEKLREERQEALASAEIRIKDSQEEVPAEALPIPTPQYGPAFDAMAARS